MKASELRIGNYVGLEMFNGAIHEVDTWAIKTLQAGNTHRIGKFERQVFHPISITKEWLLKFGFESQYDGLIFHKSGHFCEFNQHGVLKLYTGSCGDWYVCIEYIHTLQNLYFALTGEELTIKNN